MHQDRHPSSPPPEESAAGAASPFKGKSGLARVWNALHYSMEGLGAAYREEAAFRQETWLAAILIVVALVLPVGGVGKAVMMGSVFLVLMAELFNSAIEAAIDRIGPERHSLSKRAKDIGSAAVFIALVNVAVVWGCILFSAFA